jgi:hypothetical protein
LQLFVTQTHDQLPEQLKWYAAAAYHFSALWKDEANLRTFLTSQGHREFYIDTIVSYISSLHDMFQLFQMGLINIHQMSSDVITNEPGFALDNYQLAVARHIEKAVELRQRYHHIDGSFITAQMVIQIATATWKTILKMKHKCILTYHIPLKFLLNGKDPY